jgi:hypothetical protein
MGGTPRIHFRPLFAKKQLQLPLQRLNIQRMESDATLDAPTVSWQIVSSAKVFAIGWKKKLELER